jgi:hypothetical protein
MGKKNFFKLPSKKTMEHILIGILFVAVLSCTMKMMKGSFIEGFECGVEGGVCTPRDDAPTGDITGGHLLDGSAPMDNAGLAAGTDWGGVKIYFNGSGGGGVPVTVDLDNLNGGAPLTSVDIIGRINAAISPNAVAYADRLDWLHIVTLPNASTPASTIEVAYFHDDTVGPEFLVVRYAVAAALGLDELGESAQHAVTQSATPATVNLSDTLIPSPLTCTTWRAALAAAAVGTGANPVECITECDTDGSTTCSQADGNAGCELNSDSACECGWDTGTDSNKFADDGTFYLTAPFDTPQNCLKSQIQDIYGPDTGGTLGDGHPQLGWASDGTGDVCSPRRPCLASQQEYLGIIGKQPAECNVGNHFNENEMRMNFCQPYGINAAFDDCNVYDNKTACETQGDETHENQCSWNPYCVTTSEGIDSIKGGSETDAARQACQGIMDHQGCDNSGDCYWEWILAEELNGFRNPDNTIPKEISTISELQDGALMVVDTSRCQTWNGSFMDNTLCSASTALTTATGSRPPGFCTSDECGYDGANSNCTYCSTFAMTDNTPRFVPDTVGEWLEWAKVQTDHSNVHPLQAAADQCYQIFRE